MNTHTHLYVGHGKGPPIQTLALEKCFPLQVKKMAVPVETVLVSVFYLEGHSCLVVGLVLSCLVLSCLVLSCLVWSGLILSYLVLSCLVLPCLAPMATFCCVSWPVDSVFEMLVFAWGGQVGQGLHTGGKGRKEKDGHSHTLSDGVDGGDGESMLDDVRRCRAPDQYLLVRRGEQGLLAGQWEFPTYVSAWAAMFHFP
jgi:hypothetical protein